MSVEPPPNLPPRRKRDFERPLGGGALNPVRLLIYGVITAVLIGLALYMALVAHHALTSPYVIAPAVGAVWFALRLFMIWSSNARG